MPTRGLGLDDAEAGDFPPALHTSETGPLLEPNPSWTPRSPDPRRPLLGLARRRLHPLALLPAVLLGVILALGVERVPGEWVPECVCAVDPR